MGILNNIFGSKVRVVRDSSGNWYTSKNTASWSGDGNLQLSLCSPVLMTGIDIRADYRSKVRYIEYNSQNEEVENSEIVERLNNPNPYQTKEDFIKQNEWYKLCYGWVFEAVYDSLQLPNYMYNLNPSCINFNKDFKKQIVFKKSEANELDRRTFTYTDYATQKTMTIGDVLPFYDLANGLLNNNPYESPSRIDAIRKSVENIQRAVDAENIITSQIGREMVYKEKSNDQFNNNLPLLKEDKKDAERKFSNYGAQSGRNRTVFTNKEMGWKSMHIPHDELGFTEILENNSSLATQALRIPNEIYQFYRTGATFENQEKAEVRFIQNVIQPIEDNRARAYSKRYNKDIRASFAHLPSMQKTENEKVDKILKVSTALRNLTQSGLSIEEATNYMEQNGLNLIKE